MRNSKFLVVIVLSLWTSLCLAEPFPTIEVGRITLVKPVANGTEWEVLVKDPGCGIRCLPVRLKLDASARVSDIKGNRLATEIIASSRNQYVSVTYKSTNNQILYITLL